MSKQNPTEVTRPKFDEMCAKVSCQFIMDGYVKDTVFVNGVEYVITGSIGSGNGGTTHVWGHKVIDLHKYNGDLPVLDHLQHLQAVYAGERERGYRGQSTKYGERTILFIGEQIEFIPTDEGQQMSLL